VSAMLGFVEALESGVEHAKLRALLDDVGAREGPEVVVTCIETWAAHAASHEASHDEEAELRSLLFAALDEVARRGEVTSRRQAALRAHELAHDALQPASEDDARRAACRLLMLSTTDDPTLRQAVLAVGGDKAAVLALETQLKSERVKKDALESTGHRRALARVAELSGDVERAFFESLKILRKLPDEPLFVDEAFRLALLASRETELVLVLRDLVDDVALLPSHRATIANKIAHMLERSLEDPRGALAAYLASLALLPTSKGARRHAERLARDLGIAVDLDAPPAPGAAFLSTVGGELVDGPPAPRTPAPDDVVTAKASVQDLVAASETSSPPPAAEPVWASPLGHTANEAAEQTVVSEDRFAEFSGIESMSPSTATIAERRPTRGPESGLPFLPPPLPDDVDDDLAPFDDDDALHDATTPVGPVMQKTTTNGPSTSDGGTPTHDGGTPTHDGVTSTHEGVASTPEGVTSTPQSVGASTSDGSLVTVSAILVDDESIVAEVSDHTIVSAESVPPPLPDDDDDDAPLPSSSQAEVTLVRSPPTGLAPTREASETLAALARADAQRSVSPENKPTRVAAASVVERHRREAVPTSLGDQTPPVDGIVFDPPAAEPSSSDRPSDRSSPSAPSEPSDRTVASDVMFDPFITDEGAPVSSDLSGNGTSVSGEAKEGGGKKQRRTRRKSKRATDAKSPVPPDRPAPADDAVFEESPTAAPVVDEPAAKEAVVDESTAQSPASAPLSALEEATRALLDGEHADLVALAERDGVDASTRLRLLVAAIVLRPGTSFDQSQALALFERLLKNDEGARRAVTDVLLDARETVLSDHRENMPRLFSHAAHLARLAELALSVDDLERVLAPLALLERGPGPLFTTIDDALAQKGLLDRRIALVERAIRQSTDAEARVALLVHEIDVLESHERKARALPVLARLVLEDAPQDLALRARARAAFSQTADDEEHVLFLSRLLGLVHAYDEKTGVLRTVLSLRKRMQDEAGTLSALRALLQHAPDEVDAIDAILERLADDAPERIDLLLRRLAMARSARDDARSLRVTREVARLMTLVGRPRDAFRVELAQTETGAVDDTFLEDLCSHAVENGAADEALPALESLARLSSVAPSRAAHALRLASRLALDPLRRRARALELIDRALEVDPTNVDALLSKTELAIEVGDAQGALLPLERLAAATTDAKARARLHVRVGRLLEEHLLRLDEALRRYRAATEDDPTLREAWDHLRILARQRDDRDALVHALLGLVGLSVTVDERAALRREIAAIERDERVDLARAEVAFAELVALVPTDLEALHALLDLVVARTVGDAVPEAALRSPSPALIDALRAPLVPVLAAFEGDGGVTLPPAILRILAALFRLDGKTALAKDALERVLVDVPTDRYALENLATLLEGAVLERDRARRREVLEALLLQHAPHLGRPTAMAHWAALALLRQEASERLLAKKAARQAIELSDDETLRELAGTTLEVLVALLDDTDEATVRLYVRAVRARAFHVSGPVRAQLLVEAAERVILRLSDPLLARKLALDAAEASPRSREPRALLLKIDFARGSVDDVISSLEALADREDDPEKRADLLVDLAARLTEAKNDHAGAISALARAISACPTHEVALTRAEALFIEEKDAHGLVDLLTTRLRLLDANDSAARLALLERIAQLRRYEMRDLAGAVEALEAMTSIDPSLQKPREDCARLYTDLGNWRAAAQAWRGVLERDVLSVEAWRGLFSLFVRTEQADEALAVAQTMVATDVADAELSRTVRALRPPFPRWPRAPENLEHFRRRVAHDLERTAIHAMLEPIGRRIHPMFARPLKDFGIRRRDRLPEKSLPPSVLLAMRTVTDLLGLEGLPDLYSADLSADEGLPVPPFALLPADEPGLVVSKDVLEGGMTPERAFALGRAAQWLTPHGLLAGALGPAELKGVLEAIVLLLAPQSPLEGDRNEMAQLARAVDRELFRGLASKDADVLKAHLAAAARDYAHAREQLHVTDWSTGVGYTGDRIGFLLAGDLAPAVRLIKASGGRRQALGARLAIKELVLFSVSPNYLALRRELGLALPADVARPILES
jgi:tetratricopeptide (TPR) repeat protein